MADHKQGFIERWLYSTNHKDIGTLYLVFALAMFFIGGELAQSRLGLPNALSGVFQGVLLFSLLACDALILYRLRRVA